MNTIIAVFEASEIRSESFEEEWNGERTPWTNLMNISKFMMFKKSFEEAISSDTMITIDEAEALVKALNDRVLLQTLPNQTRSVFSCSSGGFACRRWDILWDMSLQK